MQSPVLTMNDGHTIPQLGLGVFKVADAATADLVAGAIDAGYRHIDTAALYANEAGVGDGVRASGIPREEMFVTTKVWNDRHGYDKTLRAFDESIQKLRFDYVDLYLIHWPAPKQNLFVETWKALEQLRADGRVRSIGVSNFEPHHLERLREHSDVVPAVNQIEVHPWLQQRALREYNESIGVITESWSPLARGRVPGNEQLERIGQRHGRSAAQVVLRWHVQLGLVVIPKSRSLERIRQNADVFDFELDPTELAEIALLDTGTREGMHPDGSG